jgi:hypothetical protein
MPRSADPTIPAEEALYRSVAKEHVGEHGVLAAAVDAPACSFNRSRYSAPDDVITASRPTENGILEITPGELPPPLPRADATPYEFYAADDPCLVNGRENEAHCEVRIKRTGTEYAANHKPPKDIKLKAREALARKLRIHRIPT